jgi:hypothetical protein
MAKYRVPDESLLTILAFHGPDLELHIETAIYRRLAAKYSLPRSHFIPESLVHQR